MSMKKVFLSSVAKGLEKYRDSVCAAIERLDGHHCIRMEHFGARDSAPASVCRDKVIESDIFVGILGQRYGTTPPDCELSYTELEFETAREHHRPILMFLASEEFPILARDIEEDEQRRKQIAFRARASVYTRATFEGADQLATRVVEALHNSRQQLVDADPQFVNSPKTILLFPLASNQAGFDMGFAISNTTADSFGTIPYSGTFTVHYYGNCNGSPPNLKKQTSSVVMPGEQVVWLLSTTSGGFQGMPGFQGYLIVECNFPEAYGLAFLSDVGVQKFGSCYLAQRIQRGKIE